MAKIPCSDFSPKYSIPAYNRGDPLSFCLASRLAYEKNSKRQIAQIQIRNQTKNWGFSHVEGGAWHLN